MTTPRGAPEHVQGQALQETTANEAYRHTEAGACHFPVVDKDLTAPPGTCDDGANYIIASVATGDWASKETQIATAVGANAASGWSYHTPIEGFTAYLQDENERYLFGGASWAVDTTGGSVSNLAVSDFDAAAIVTEAEGLASSDNDTSIPTTAAVKDYVDTEIAGVGGGSGTDFFDQFKVWRGARGNASGIIDLGITLTQTGSGGTPSYTTTTTLSSKMRRTVTTGASAGAFAGLRDANHFVLPRAGFKVRWSWGYSTINAADRRLFAGVTSDTLLSTNEEPDQFDHVLGFGAGAADTNFFLLHNDAGAGTATEADTGIAVATDVLYVAIIDYPAGGAPTLTLHSYATTDVTPTATYSSTLASDYPTGAQALLAYLWATNNATANTVVFAFEALDILS
jgi:hypothetical protein